MAADAAALLDALGISRAHMVGASMGGMIAQLVAINHPAKTKSLVSIMSTTGRPGLPREKPEAMQALMAMPASPGREDRIATALAAVKAIGGPGFLASDEERRAYLERSIDYTPYDPPAAARQMAAVIAAPPRNGRLKALKIPALVIHGADDPVIPAAHGEDTARSIPGAELLLVPGLGHDFTVIRGGALSEGDRRFCRQGRGAGARWGVVSRSDCVRREILVLRDAAWWPLLRMRISFNRTP